MSYLKEETQVVGAVLDRLRNQRVVLEELLGRAEAGLSKLEGDLSQMTDDTPSLVGEAWTRVLTRQRAVVAGLEEAAQRLATLPGVMETHLAAFQEIPQVLHDQLTQSEERFRQLSGDLSTKNAELKEAVTEALDSSVEGFQEHTAEQVENVKDLVEEVREECVGHAEEIEKWTTECREKAEELAEDLFIEGLPTAVNEKTKALQEGLEKLKGAGLEQLAKFKETIGGVEDKVHSTVEMIEQVKPVLDLAKQIL